MLPTLDTPVFVTVIPSTKQEIRYRPFLVKEEKILLMALEGRDLVEIKIAINQILKTCIIDEVDIDNLPVFDIEYLFLMVRSKSVGEIIEFNIGHTKQTECNHKTEVAINLNEVEIIGDIQDGKLMLTDTIGVKMHYPTIKAVELLGNNKKDIVSVIASCIDFVFDKENVYDDFTNEELVDWLDNLNRDQYQEINDFFASAPKLSYEIKWKCPACGEEDSSVIEGLNNFFM